VPHSAEIFQKPTDPYDVPGQQFSVKLINAHHSPGNWVLNRKELAKGLFKTQLCDSVLKFTENCWFPVDSFSALPYRALPHTSFLFYKQKEGNLNLGPRTVWFYDDMDGYCMEYRLTKKITGIENAFF
jgi:hypothetical protein